MTPFSPTVSPRQISSLKVGHVFVWPCQGRWFLYTVTKCWRDGVFSHCVHPDVSTPLFLPSHQWVALLPSVWKEKELTFFFQKELAVLWNPSSLWLCIRGHSMEPIIPYGAMVEVVPWEQQQRLKVGQVVTWAHPACWNTHRIRKVCWLEGQRMIITRGDALSHDDPPLASSQILGVVKQVRHQKDCWEVSSIKAQLDARKRWLVASIRSNIRRFLFR